MSSRRRSRWRLAPLVGVAVIANLIFQAAMTSSWFDARLDLGPGANANVPLDVSLIEPTVLNPYVAPPSPAEQQQEIAKKVEEAKKPEDNPDEHGQVVDINKPAVEIRPDKAKYLSEFDSKVEHETRGKVGRDKPGAAHPEKKVASVQPRPAVPDVPEVAPKPATRGGGEKMLAMRSTEPVKPDEARGHEDGIEKTAPEGTEAPKGAPPEHHERSTEPGVSQPAQPGQKGQKGQPGVDVPPNVNLQPSQEVLASAVGGTGSPDYLKDVDDGDETLLNTKRWKYWSFFSRVKRGVAQVWRPENAYRLRDPTGQIYGMKNRMTVLRVSLRPDGSLFADPIVEKASGVDFLDDEAVSAFKTAQPFPNPPPGLVDKESNLITFRFGFYFEVGGGPVFKVFRQ